MYSEILCLKISVPGVNVVLDGDTVDSRSCTKSLTVMRHSQTINNTRMYTEQRRNGNYYVLIDGYQNGVLCQPED